MIIYYENSKKEKIDLLSKEFHVVNTDVFDSRWDSVPGGYEKKVEFDVMNSDGNLVDLMNRLYDVFAYDSENDRLGRLYVNGTYIQCNVVNSKKDSWKGLVYTYVTLTFKAQRLAWIDEVSRMFAGSAEQSDDGKSYPHDYPYDYAKPVLGRAVWEIDHIKPSPFSMVINGFVENPEIEINGYKYRIYTTLNEGEYLILDSQTKTIMKTLIDGTTVNAFDLRDTENSVFREIPSGTLVIKWTGTFSFKIYVYKERREPLWM